MCCIINHTKLSGLKQQPIIKTHGSVSHSLVSNSSAPRGVTGALAGVQLGTLAWRAESGSVLDPTTSRCKSTRQEVEAASLSYRLAKKWAHYHFCHCLLVKTELSKTR